MATVRASETVSLDPGRALALWTDVRRWPTFIEGFGRAVEVERDWPREGGKLVWESIRGGRGRVTERATAYEPPGAGPARMVSQVFEDALSGTQSVEIAQGDGGALIELALDYELTSSGPLRKLADVLFIRRALADALSRTLRRFATEAEEDAALEPPR
jgi:hypothetical protein